MTRVGFTPDEDDGLLGVGSADARSEAEAPDWLLPLLVGVLLGLLVRRH